MNFEKVDIDDNCEVLLKSVNNLWHDYTEETVFIQNYLNKQKNKRKRVRIVDMKPRNMSKLLRKRKMMMEGRSEHNNIVPRKIKHRIRRSRKLQKMRFLNRQQNIASSSHDVIAGPSDLNVCKYRDRSSLATCKTSRHISTGNVDSASNIERSSVVTSGLKYTLHTQNILGSPVCSTTLPSQRDSASQNNVPLIVDVTNVNQNKPGKKSQTVKNMFIDKEYFDCFEEPCIVVNPGTENINLRKRKRSLDFVEIISENIQAKDSSVVCLQNDEQSDSEDSCSVISIGSDDEVTVVDKVTKPNKRQSSDVVIDSPPSKRPRCVVDIVEVDRKCASDVTLIDLSLPAVVPVNRCKEKLGNNKAVNKNPMNNQSTYKDYVSVLANKAPSSTVTSRTMTNANDLAGTNIPDCIILDSSYGPTALSTNPVDVQSVSSNAYGDNYYNPNRNEERIGLRPVVIDGSNVAMGHANGKNFSCRGLKICIDFFLKRNHKVIAFVPKFRRSSHHTLDRELLDDLEKAGLVTFTPSRRVGSSMVISYDDRYIVQYAAECGGVIVSTDNYRDLLHENISWRETIEKRLLMFTWVGDVIMFPQDPLGKLGPHLERFLRFP